MVATTGISATSREGQRAQHNAQILQASMDVSISAGNHSLTLLYRAAVDKLNEVLAPELGADAIAQAQQQDQSSEAVAGRIVSMGTALFERYAAKYPDKDPETLLQDFVATLRGGFEQGYGEAKDILEGLGVCGVKPIAPYAAPSSAPTAWCSKASTTFCSKSWRH